MRSPLRRLISKILAPSFALVLVVFSGQASRADFLTIYGGPTYNPATGGYSSPVLSMLPGRR